MINIFILKKIYLKMKIFKGVILMIYWTNYNGHEPKIIGKRKKVDNTIYTFDIESTSIIILNNKIMHGIEYDKLTKDEQEQCEFYGFMYIWMFSINDVVYYGRTWDEFKKFINKINQVVPERKLIFVHNLRI